MSSRALRRLQREQEEARLAQQIDASEEESEEEVLPQRPVQKSAFDLLSAANEDEDDEDDSEHVADEEAKAEDPEPVALLSKAGKKSKKKKKKAKGKKVAENSQPSAGDGMDEIDRALQSLKASEAAKEPAYSEERPAAELLRFYSLLAVNRNDLNALNEMKKLFGSAVLGRDEDEDEQARRRQRGAQQLNLEQALSARYNRLSRGQGLSGLALRQNVFMAGKPTWPKLPSGGLSMEIVEKLDDFTTEYRFVHKPEYQRAQKKFEDATQTLQADHILALAVQQPYHIATLLQTGEILKQQGDHSLAGDLYERALYNFGRSVQSTFGTALAEGKARMDFRRPENREFWLTTWRHIGALVQRGTFRTAYEWAKLLLSLDPEGVEGDPYRIRLIIDQLALRGGQSQHLIDLTSTKLSLIDWGQDSPNIRISRGLAQWRLKQTQEAEDTLRLVVKDFPWIFARLYQQLDIDKLPPAIWGQQARTPFENLESESYAVRAKDIWNTPETLNFLRIVVDAAPKADPPTPDHSKIIGLNEARHVIVSEIPQLISTLPREFTNMQTTSSDPLPPADNVLDYVISATEQDIDDELSELEETVRQETQGDAGGITGWLGRAINRFMSRDPDLPIPTPEELNQELERAGYGAAQHAGGQNLGDELGMENVTVRTLDEYNAAMLGGQFPIVAEDAAEAFNRELQQQQQGTQDMRALVERESSRQAAAEETRRQAEAEVERRQARQQVTIEDEEDEEDESSTPLHPEPEPYDEDANKRWLAGRGMLALKDFTAQHGSDEKTWKNKDAETTKIPREYVERVNMLRQRTNRNWILDFALRQGAGAETSAMVRRLLDAGWAA